MITHVHKVFAGFGAFGKMKCPFSIVPDANSWWLAHWSKGGEDRSENRADASVGPMTGRWIQKHRTLTACVWSRWLSVQWLGFTTGRWLCPVEVDRTRLVEENQVSTLTVLDRTLRFQRPVSFNRTRPVEVGTLLEMTGRWGFSIRSVEAAASGQRHSRWNLTNSVWRRWHVASIGRPDAKGQRPVSMTGASGQYDRSVRSERVLPSEGV
jgi:hypothetical protein